MGEPTQADEFPVLTTFTSETSPSQVFTWANGRRHDAFDFADMESDAVPLTGLDSLIAEKTPSEAFDSGRSIARGLIERWNTAAKAEYAAQPKWRRVWWSVKRWWHGRGTTAEVAVCFLGLGYGLGLMTASLVVRWLS